METLQEPTQFGLRTSDQLWMAKFGASANWQDDPFLLDKLQALVVLGSQRINDSDNELQHHEIVDAREQFFKFVGIQPTVIEALRKVSTDLTPIDTFIGTQRVMYDLGLDAVKIINGCPSAISYGPQSVREKVTNLTDLGLDAIKIINGFPSAISYAPQSVREKVLNLTDLGLGAVKIINRLPSVIGLSIESVREKVTNLTDLGLDAVKIINGCPSALGFALESVREKVTNLTDLGLDAVKIINGFPSALGFALESVREKVTNLTDLEIGRAHV